MLGLLQVWRHMKEIQDYVAQMPSSSANRKRVRDAQEIVRLGR